MRTRCLRTVLLTAFWIVCGTSAFAQQLTISGTVRDDTGVVPDATVTLSTGGKSVSTVNSDGSGVYRFTGLTPGSYELSINKLGFEPVNRVVALNQDITDLVVALAVGRVSTTLTVTASAGRATASRLPVADDDIPAQVSSIPQELLRQQGINSIMDGLRNASGVQAMRWYGVYEQYTIRGFHDPDRDNANAVLIDGMRLSGNRYSTQTNNIQSIEVLKGPSSILYGRGAVGGAINVVRKKPQGVRAYDFGYRAGRFNTHQVSAGATGPIGSSNRFIYRVDTSFDHSDGWRKAGADRFNISPAITWVIGESARLSVHQTFNRDRFDGDGGVPINITGLPSYRPDLRFSLPQDRVLVKDSQTNIVFNGNFTSSWEFRNSFLVQPSSDRYFVTEGVYGDPENNEVFREPLDFHHHRTPFQNQTELIGKWNGFLRHTLAVGYEYQNDEYRTDVTAGDDPGCVCGFWLNTITPMNISTLEENTPTLDVDTIARQTFNENRIHSFFWQDQIEVLPQLKFNVGGRFDDYKLKIDRIFTSDPNTLLALRNREQSAYTYRAGVVYSPQLDMQIYFGTSSSYRPETGSAAADNAGVEPRTARNYEVGHRWQGWDGRIDTNVAYYYVIQNNLLLRQGPNTWFQVGEQKAQGIDLDVNSDLGSQIHLIFNYGYSRPRFEDAETLTGMTPRFVPNHTANLWLRKDFRSGFNASIGGRYVGEQFIDDANTSRLGGYSIFSAAVGYRTTRWDWALNIDNLFDRERYFLPGHFSNLVFPGQPIGVTSSIRLRMN